MMDYNNNNELDQDLSHFLKSHEVKFKVSKDDEWKRLQQSMEAPPFYQLNVFRYAAGIVLLIGLSLFVRFYSRTIDCPKGQHLAYQLPDQSEVQLNADSELSYHPLWWYITREVELQGEAFFKVQKGSRFTVQSNQGNTSVLGTSFNVHARNNSYLVACVTGKVRVQTINEEYILTPGKTVVANVYTKMAETSSEDQKRFIAWKNRQLMFIGRPLNEVFEALERQYNVTIQFDLNDKHLFSGNLELTQNINTNLLLVCKPFFMNTENIDNNTIRVYKNKR